MILGKFPFWRIISLFAVVSVPHIKSLADEVEEQMEKENIKILHKEGYNSARWILLDYGSVVIHIFHEEDRDFYNLERLWADGVMKHRE